ncbi:MAG TPA: DUF4350 domain-containing protein [Frankiaceae bacterium]|nr:DUF4350 domain-containing protein [Frankiaceae bacterium]
MTLTDLPPRPADIPVQPASSDQPTRARPPRWWKRPGVLGALAAVVLLLVVVVLTLLATGTSRGDDLDPRSASPSGTLALAELLKARGVDTSRGGTAPAGGTLVIPFASSVEPKELDRVLNESGAASRVVLLAPSDVPGTAVTEGRGAAVSSRPPSCVLPAAQTAGTARTGSRGYLGGSPSCYAGSLVLTQHGPTQVVVLGSASFLTNKLLDEDGNAALALGVFSGDGLPGPRSTSVVWYRPSLDPQATRPGLLSLLPSAVLWATLQLIIAVVLFALWRARRLGPVVEEPLPVVVPAAETVEGRARLYAAGRARAAAADALRTGARARLGNALEHGGEPDPVGLVTAVAARAGRQPGEVALLLYGSAGPPATTGVGTGAVSAAPADDAELIRLADHIDRLEREVRAR